MKAPQEHQQLHHQTSLVVFCDRQKDDGETTIQPLCPLIWWGKSFAVDRMDENAVYCGRETLLAVPFR